MLLKGVFDYSLNEIAELVGATVGGVEAALSRGRWKLADSRERSKSSRVAQLRMQGSCSICMSSDSTDPIATDSVS